MSSMSMKKAPPPAAPESTLALYRAIREDNADQLRVLLRKEKINPNVVDPADELQETPLLVACSEQKVELVRMLVKNKYAPADVNCENAIGKRPIWYAVQYHNPELAEVLIKDALSEIDVNYLDKRSGCTPLYRAILNNDAALVREILHAGANVNLRRLGFQEESLGETPLIKAVQLNNYEIAVMLVNSLCDLHAKTNSGFTALHYAVAYRRYNITEFLLEQRSKLHGKASGGITPMTLAISQHLPAMVKLLIEFGYKMDRTFEWKETPLEMAIRVHSEDCAMTLVHWGCDVRRNPKRLPRLHIPQSQKNKESLFKMAADEGLVRLVRLMIEINPAFLQEAWVVQRTIPHALYKKPDFCKWLFDSQRQPKRLTEWCKAWIFFHVGKYPPNRLTKLPLPAKIITFLEFNDHFSDKMYCRKTIETVECPYDCTSLCLETQCPELDFSDSGSEYDDGGDKHYEPPIDKE